MLFITIFLLMSVTASYAESASPYCQNQLSAKPTDNGFTWTLASRMAQALREAEKHYGKRDKSWTLLGVEFTTAKQPQVWYPYSQDNEKFLIIQLTQKASCNDKEALFQLSHEVIHLLSPAGGGVKTNVFEEGLAAYFSVQFLKQQGFDVSDKYIGITAYKEAYNAVASLYELEEDADQRIEMLRLENSNLSGLSEEQIIQAFPNIDKDLVARLVAKF